MLPPSICFEDFKQGWLPCKLSEPPDQGSDYNNASLTEIISTISLITQEHLIQEEISATALHRNK